MAEGVAYRVALARPGAHVIEVNLVIASPDEAGQRLSLPAWIPGSYMIRDFARHIVRISASCGGVPVELRKLDKQTWQCAPCTGPLEVSYDVYAHDLSVRGAHFDSTHAFFNGTSVFLEVQGKAHQTHAVELVAPPGRDWSVATTLPEASAKRWGFGGYQAGDYDELIDHPVEIGDFERIEFEACGVAHTLVMTGLARYDRERLRDDAKRICETHIGLFDEPAPMDRYLFLTMITESGYGGLEHRASTSLHTSRDSLPRAGGGKPHDSYVGLLGLISHEYFHTWNVKRIRPERFASADLSREVHTELLWAFEGITSYYDDLALRRSGVIDRDAYLDLLARIMTRVRRGTGRLHQTVAESSFDAWTKFYKQDENAPNAIVSYYAKGALVALALDLTLRTRTDGASSLDDVMRGLWQRYGKTGTGVPEQGVEELAAELSGVELGDFFDAALRSTDDLPLGELLASFGVECSWRLAQDSDDKGGRFKGTPKTKIPDLGVRLRDEGGRTLLTHVLEGGTAQVAGLSAGDELVALGGLRVSTANFARRMGRLEVGETVEVLAFRRDEQQRFEVTLHNSAEDTCELSLSEELDPDDPRRARLEAWLGP